MRVKLFFLGLVVVDSTSDDYRVLNSCHSTLWRHWSMVAQKSWYGDVFHTTALGLFIIYQGSWVSLNTSKYLNLWLCCHMPQRKCPWNGCFNKTTNPNTNKQATSWFRTKRIDVMGWPTQSPRPQPNCLWCDIKNSVSEAKPWAKTQLRYQITATTYSNVTEC